MSSASTINIQQPTHKVSFLGVDTTSFNVVGFGNTPGSAVSNIIATPGPVPILTFITQNPQFWIETDSDGNAQLCTTKRVGMVLTGQFQSAAGGPVINRVALSYEYVDNENGSTSYLPKAQA